MSFKTLYLSLTLVALFSNAHSATQAKTCGYKETTAESIEDCFEKLGAEKTIQCFTFGASNETNYFPCDKWEEQKKLKINLYKQRLENFKEKYEQIWNIVEIYVHRGDVVAEPEPIKEKSCGLSGPDEEKIADCKKKFGDKKSIQCLAEPFSFNHKLINCEHWFDFAAENIPLTKQVLVTLKDFGSKYSPIITWKTLARFTPKNEPGKTEEEIIENYNRPRFPDVSCGQGGSIKVKMEDCSRTLAEKNISGRICYITRSTSINFLRKVPCVAEAELKSDGSHVQSWRLITMDGPEFKIWFDESTKFIWSSLLPKTRSVFSGIKTCNKGESPIMGGIDSLDASFFMPSCGELTTAINRGLSKLMNLEKSPNHQVWCNAQNGSLKKWNVMGNYVTESLNPFENNSLICAGFLPR